MSNHICALLSKWQSEPDLEWVLATIIETDGSSYRKTGAMMLINSLGQYHGLLSGGCLEADIMLQARKCLASGNSKIIKYDMRDDEDIAWQLGIGCGGMVQILLQPIQAQNCFLSLIELKQKLEAGETVYYQQSLTTTAPENKVLTQEQWQTQFAATGKQKRAYFVSEQKPLVRLAVFGGGVDAQPLVAMAATLGWQVTLFDSRMGYAKDHYFPSVAQIERSAYETLDRQVLDAFDATVLMNHNMKMDAASLKLAFSSRTRFVGLLGPRHRTEKVLAEAGLTHSDINKPLASPIGLNVGGELPESIALSILSQIHAFLYDRDASVLAEYDY